MRVTIILLPILLFTLGGWAQPRGNLRHKVLVVTSDTIRVDSLSIIPNSLVAIDSRGHLVKMEQLRVNYARATVAPGPPFFSLGDTISVSYRVFPIRFVQSYSLREYHSSLSPDSLLGRERPRGFGGHDEESIFGEGIRSSGSFSRGINFGNSQSLSVRSGMNIQLSGELAPDLFVEGAISDRDIPLQPSGNTVKYQEFDRVYLKVFSKNFAVQAGDIKIGMESPSGQMRFARNVQGVAYDGLLGKVGTFDSLGVGVSTSVPKGKFTRNTIRPQSGNQGPYRLMGGNGEPVIIVISGSERVYVDGSLMRRGEMFEYTIDYNTAELTFTSQMPITANSRIVVEFEYSERSYARYTVHTRVDAHKGKWHWALGAFSETDSRNQPFDQELTTEQMAHLASIGNDISQAFFPQVDSVGFSPEAILYERVDTVVGSTNYTIYRHSTRAAEAKFRVSFSNVGQGKGNYVPHFASANGRVFRWVAPIDGVLQGSFEPVKRLVPPRKQQMAMFSVGRGTAGGSGCEVSGAVSNFDPNTFSKLDSDENLGFSLMGTFSQSFPLADTLKVVEAGANFLLSSAHFSLVDRIRPVEFEREWAIEAPLMGQGEQQVGAWFAFKKRKFSEAKLTAEHLQTEAGYSGYRGMASGAVQQRRLYLGYNLSMLGATDSATQRTFARGNIEATYRLERIKLGFLGQTEDLRIGAQGHEGYLPNSRLWYQARFFISTPDTLSERMEVSYTMRNDMGFEQTSAVPREQTQVFLLKLASERPRTGTINLHGGMNSYKPNSQWLPGANDEDNFLGRIEMANQIMGRFIVFSAAYDLSSGLEVGNEYYFIEVPAGQGVFAWNDYNGNGQQELSEFEVANFPDEAKYIRVNFPSNESIRVKTTAFNFNFSIAPKAIIKAKKGWLAHLARFTNQTSFQINQKNRFEHFKDYSNPFAGAAYDTLVTQSMRQFNNSLALNRGARKWGVEHIYSRSGGAQLQANGFEYKNLESHRLVGWLEVIPQFTLTLETQFSEAASVSQYFESRNFEVQSLSPMVAIRYGGRSDLTAEVGYSWRNSVEINGMESVAAHTIFAKSNLSPSPKLIISLNASVISCEFEGSANSPVGYELLKGLQSGINVTWELSVRRRLSKTFELETGYFGRYLGDGRVVHTGSMQVRAFF